MVAAKNPKNHQRLILNYCASVQKNMLANRVLGKTKECVQNFEKQYSIKKKQLFVVCWFYGYLKSVIPVWER